MRPVHFVIAVLLVLNGLLLFAVVQFSTPQDAQRNQPLPEFVLDALPALGQGFSSADLKGKWSVINVWASWCAPCRAEHPYLMALAESQVPIYGINYKDDPQDAKQFLATLGNPYVAVGRDITGQVVLDFGIYGIPETYVVDTEGRIVWRTQGPLTADTTKELFLTIAQFE